EFSLYGCSNRLSPHAAPIPGAPIVLPAAALQRAGLRHSGRARAPEPLHDLRLPGLELVPGLGALLLEPGRRRAHPAAGRVVQRRGRSAAEMATAERYIKI